MPRLFTFRVYKNLGSKGGGKEWCNEYQGLFGDEITVESPAVALMADGLVSFEKQFHYDQVFFNRVTVSTYEEDGDALLPNEKTLGYEERGQIAVPTGGKLYPLEAVVRVNLGANSGRAGYKEFRGALSTTDISAGDSPVLQPNPAFITRFNMAVSNYLNADGPVRQYLRIVTDKGNQQVARAVTSVTFSGLKFQKRTATRRPKVSLDGDAILGRLQALIKELLFVSASIGAAKALGGIDNAADIDAAIISMRDAATAAPNAQ